MIHINLCIKYYHYLTINHKSLYLRLFLCLYRLLHKRLPKLVYWKKLGNIRHVINISIVQNSSFYFIWLCIMFPQCNNITRQNFNFDKFKLNAISLDSFFEICQTDNCSNSFLPYHCPKICDCFRFWSWKDDLPKLIINSKQPSYYIIHLNVDIIKYLKNGEKFLTLSSNISLFPIGIL